MSVLERFDKENCSCFPWDFNDFPHWRLTTGLLRSVGRPVIGLGIHQSVRFSPPLNDFQHHSNQLSRILSGTDRKEVIVQGVRDFYFVDMSGQNET